MPEVHDALARRLVELGADDADSVAHGLAAALGGAEGGNVEDAAEARLAPASWRCWPSSAH